jgi:hypothetical protein
VRARTDEGIKKDPPEGAGSLACLHIFLDKAPDVLGGGFGLGVDPGKQLQILGELGVEAGFPVLDVLPGVSLDVFALVKASAFFIGHGHLLI